MLKTWKQTMDKKPQIVRACLNLVLNFKQDSKLQKYKTLQKNRIMKTLCNLLSITMLVLLSFNVQAQNQNYPSTFSLNIGESLVGSLWHTLDGEYTDLGEFDRVSLQATHKPALQLNYDQRIANWFSLGVAASRQDFGLDGLSIADTDENEPTVTREVDINFRRANISVRPLFHYANKNRVDLYSGLRVGYSFWIADVAVKESRDEVIEEEVRAALPQISGISLQLIPFGMRFYITENLGLNGELAIGSPHFISGGLSYRF